MSDGSLEKMLLKPREAAQMLSISERKLWSLMNSGEIPVVRCGSSTRYAPDDLRRWIEKNTSKSNEQSREKDAS